MRISPHTQVRHCRRNLCHGVLNTFVHLQKMAEPPQITKCITLLQKLPSKRDLRHHICVELHCNELSETNY